jgi:hypothetical protein
MTVRKTLFAATSSVALALAAAPAVLLSAGAATAQAEQTYSAGELDAFVAAFLDVGALRTVYTERLQQATDETEQQAIVEEGNAAIVAAINEVEGMDVELYAAILQQAGEDQELNGRITRRLQEADEG